MRTCPACGEDTDAGYAEACTECGFSAVGEQPAPAPDAPDTAADPEPPDPPPPEAEPKRKRTVARGLIWLVVLAGFFGVERLGIFDQPPGPPADEVEAAIADSARQFGVTVTVQCPDDAEDTEAEATFVCTATDRRGRSVEIVVTNHEDTFEWQTGPLSTLGGRR